MAQVVTNDNIVEFIQTGKVAEFKAPEEQPVKEAAAKEPAQGDKPELQPRSADGKFESPTGEKSPAEKGKAAPQPADDEDPDSANLTEHARRVIGKKHRRMKEAEEFGRDEARRAMAAEERAERAERELQSLKSGKGPAPSEGESADPDEPKPDDFKTVGEYTRALTKYEVAKAAKAAGETNARRSAEHRAKAQADETTQGFVQRQKEFMQATPDYEEVIGESELNMPNIGIQYIVESEMGPQLAYHLAKHPEVVDRLSKLSPSRVLAELGKLEARLEEGAKPKDPPKGDPATQPTRQVSRAPAPIQPLSGDAATPVQKDPSQMSFQELRAHRLAERAAGKRV